MNLTPCIGLINAIRRGELKYLAHPLLSLISHVVGENGKYNTTEDRHLLHNETWARGAKIDDSYRKAEKPQGMKGTLELGHY